MGWKDGKTKAQIQEIIDKRKKTLAKNKRKGTTVKLQRKAKKLKKATKRKGTRKVAKEGFVRIDELRGKQGVYYVGVRFKTSAQIYTYMTDIPDIQKDDKVVVLAPGGYEVVTVVQVSVGRPATSRGYAMKWVVDKVDTTSYKLREQIEQRKALLRSKIAQRKKDRELELSGSELAEHDNELAELENEWAAIA